MGEMRDSDWSRQNLLRSDWLGLIVATMTTLLFKAFYVRSIDSIQISSTLPVIVIAWFSVLCLPCDCKVSKTSYLFQAYSKLLKFEILALARVLETEIDTFTKIVRV